MRFSLSLAATACLLAISNATSLTISGNTQQEFTTYDSSCHNVGTWESPRLQVRVSGSPVNVYRGSNCANGIKTVYARNTFAFIDGPIRSYRVVGNSNPPMNTP